MGFGLGIDIGTTFSTAAVSRAGGAKVVSLGQQANAIPTVVYLDEDGEFVVGDVAERLASQVPQRGAREFKRRVGDSNALLLGGSPATVDRCLAEVLRWIYGRVQEFENASADAVTVTHPANWDEFKLDVLREAVRMADLPESTQLMAAPIAAATWYGHTEKLDADACLAVYDLGGGTFDTLVLCRDEEGGFETLGEAQGIDQLGGIDLDQALLTHVLEAVDYDPQDEARASDPAAPWAMAKLRRACVEAKESLSAETSVRIPVWLPGVSRDVVVRRTELEELVEPLLAPATEALSKALGSAQVEPDDLTEVLLVGAATRMPAIARDLSTQLGRPINSHLDPKDPTCLGAALHALARHDPAAAAEPAARPKAAPVSSIEPAETEILSLDAVDSHIPQWPTGWQVKEAKPALPSAMRASPASPKVEQAPEPPPPAPAPPPPPSPSRREARHARHAKRPQRTRPPWKLALAGLLVVAATAAGVTAAAVLRDDDSPGATPKDDPGSSQLTEGWVKPVSDKEFPASVDDEGNVYVIGSDGVPIAYDADGKELWRNDTLVGDASQLNDVDVWWAGDTVFVALGYYEDYGSPVSYALEPASGDVRWESPGLHLNRRAEVVDNRLFVHDYTELYSLDLMTGDRAGSAPLAMDAVEERLDPAPVMVGDTLVVGGAGGRVLGVDPATLRKLWDFDVDVDYGSSYLRDLVPLGSEVAAISDDGAVTAIDIGGGNESWSGDLGRELPELWFDGSATGLGDSLAVSIDGGLILMNGNGPQDVVPADQGGSGVLASAASDNAAVLWAADGKLQAFDEDGQPTGSDVPLTVEPESVEPGPRSVAVTSSSGQLAVYHYA